METKSPMIIFSNVSFDYGINLKPRRKTFRGRWSPNTAGLHDITFDVAAGEVVGISGDNGSGKTTLLRLAAGLMQPKSGTLLVRCNPILISGLVSFLDWEETGATNIRILTSLFDGFGFKGLKQAILDIKKHSSLGDYLNLPVKTYSTGMKNILALDLIKGLRYPYLLLDETLDPLDDEAITIFFNGWRSCSPLGCMMLVSHNPKVLSQCDRVVTISDGQLREN
jgi:ABC-type polysaccharide/polyol phosphate transport system ATPase subunit